MSLHPHRPEPVPEGTARIARAAFPKGNVLMKMRDTPRSNIVHTYLQ